MLLLSEKVYHKITWVYNNYLPFYCVILIKIVTVHRYPVNVTAYDKNNPLPTFPPWFILKP